MIPAINVKTEISNSLRISGVILQTHTDSTTNHNKYFGKHKHIMRVSPLVPYYFEQRQQVFTTCTNSVSTGQTAAVI